MPKKWRNKPTRMMINRTLEKKEIPDLLMAMAEDGVSGRLFNYKCCRKNKRYYGETHNN